MSDFDTDERSTSGNRPIDLYTIATPTVTYRLTSHIVDVTYASNVYAATTMARGKQEVAQDLTGREILIHLPLSHPLILRYVAQGIPEHGVNVTMHRLQESSGIALQQWNGFATAIALDGHTATIRVPSLTDDAMNISLPAARAQKICNHVLYDAQCTRSRISATNGPFEITAISGNVFATTATGVEHYLWGEIVHIASGQRRMIIAAAEPVLTVMIPFFDVVVGDEVMLVPGCDHTVETCLSKWNNVVNFGGAPEIGGSSNGSPWVGIGSAIGLGF